MAAPLDVAIVGGGPAGLACALTLARARRTVAIIDNGHPRNAASRQLRGYLTRDGILPGDFLHTAWGEVLSYPTVQFIQGRVESAIKVASFFEAHKARDCFELNVETMAGDMTLTARKVVLATGVTDELPPVQGAAEMLGRGLFHCPYCDGYEVGDCALAVYGRGRRGYELATLLRNWSAKVALLTDGGPRLSWPQQKMLKKLDVLIVPERIEAFRESSVPGCEIEVSFRVKEVEPKVIHSFGAVFFNLPSYGKSHLAKCLGVKTNGQGAIKVGKNGQTSVAGVWAAGNVLKDVMLTQVAAAQGVEAAFSIVSKLVREDQGRD